MLKKDLIYDCNIFLLKPTGSTIVNYDRNTLLVQANRRVVLIAADVDAIKRAPAKIFKIYQISVFYCIQMWPEDL